MIETYTFKHGTTTYTYTSTDDAISRSAIASSMVSTGEQLQIAVPRDNPVAVLFRHAPPTQPVTVTIAATGQGQIWTGVVQQVRWSGSGATLECVDILSGNRKLLNPHRFGRNCRHILYDRGCKADPEDFVDSVTITAIAPETRTVTVSGVTVSDRFRGGILRVGGEKLQIVDVMGQTLTLMGWSSSLAVGPAELIRGCDHTIYTCHAWFSNAANFGGFPSIESSPFMKNIAENEGVE